jgi:hypothetical protein
MLTCARRLVNTASHAVSCCLKDSTAIQVQLVDDRVSVAIDHVAGTATCAPPTTASFPRPPSRS